MQILTLSLEVSLGKSIMSNIQDNIKHIKEEIVKFATNVKRNPNDISLLAVSKTKPISDIIEAYNAGQRQFGESYAQEACDKIEKLQAAKYHDIEWHFIGPCQSNKTKIIAEHFDVVQSVDRTKIATRLNEQRPTSKGILRVMIQVNISDEEQKSGISPQNLRELASFIANHCPKLKIIGLMGIAQDTTDTSKITKQFQLLASLQQELALTWPDIKALSLGMTHDMQEAIACGSTMVRIGTAIFGARNYNN